MTNISPLRAFFAENKIKQENVFYAASKSFIDENGEPIKWELKSIDNETDEALRNECMRKVQVPGRRNAHTPEMDMAKYLGKLAAACTVFPNLNDKELQDSYHVMCADALLKKMLSAGEYGDYLLKVQEVNGYDRDQNELVEEAKN